jgi:hypothetical protein
VIKLDQKTLRPSPWTPEARAVAEGLLHPRLHDAGRRSRGRVTPGKSRSSR